MPCEHLRALIQELHPGVTVRQLTLAADLDANRIAYYLKPSTHIDVMPRMAVMKEIARALGCDVTDVVEAFAADVGVPWGPPMDDPDLRSLIRTYRRLSDADRTTLRRVALSLAGGVGG